LSILSQFKVFHRVYFSQPKSDRVLYRAVRRQRVTSILELGIGDLDKALRLITMAGQIQADPTRITYTGIDLFDARGADLEPLHLKQAHQCLSRSGAKIKLVPGDADEGLTRTANALLDTDLVIIHRSQTSDRFSRAWFYLPRILHQGTEIFQEESVEDDAPSPAYRSISHQEIHQRAQSSVGQHVA
jgi:hypothetical protein